MERKNASTITVIHVLGFLTPHNTTFFIFFLFLVVYCVTICGNFVIIILVTYSRSLHSPMYFFLSQLSVSDILLATDILPNTLHAVLVGENILSTSECIAQFFFFALSETLECLLLSAMCYDRYLAICRPLHYSLAMSFRFCWTMIITCWVLSFLIIIVHTLMILQLEFCGPAVVDHFFCDLYPILQLSCYDTTDIQLQETVLSIVFAFLPFCAIIVSYVYIIFTIFKIPSITGRQKVFSTCSSHLTVVFIFYGTILCVYMIPKTGQPWNITKFLSLLYTVGTPLLNPIIYSLRNTDLKNVMAKIFNHSLNTDK
ncbi:olfactory receptor 2A12-like [Mantella aurantiaca]